jgi:hypothetical protein
LEIPEDILKAEWLVVSLVEILALVSVDYSDVYWVEMTVAWKVALLDQRLVALMELSMVA